MAVRRGNDGTIKYTEFLLTKVENRKSAQVSSDSTVDDAKEVRRGVRMRALTVA